MSVWKKASKVNQKTHRERHQPDSRKHLGLLEKHKDYVKRAHDYNDKKATLKLLNKRALNKNPDEFYHHMINSKVNDGLHREKEKQTMNDDDDNNDTSEQIQLMATQDLKYINTKRVQEMKKIERMQGELHLINVNHGVKNTHLRFASHSIERVQQQLVLPSLGGDDDDDDEEPSSEAAKAQYKQLGKRIQREHALQVLHDKLQMKRHLANKTAILPPKRVRKGSRDSAPVYEWKYERKK